MLDVARPVYLVRHGQSEWNLRRLTQGQTAHPRLTQLGREQAARAAALIRADLAPSVGRAGRPAARVVSSDLVRAVETADILVEHLGGEVILDARLREQHLGALQGTSYEVTWAAVARLDRSDPGASVAGGESLTDVHDRMTAVLADLDTTTPWVLVSHGDAIRATVAGLRALRPHHVPWDEVPNGAVARVDRGLRWLGQ